MHRILALMLCLAAAPLSAQQTFAAYFAELAPQDMRNSRGVPIHGLGMVLQQDRANVHRFNIRQGGDEGDPFFADHGLRARIPQLYANGPRSALIERIIANGDPLGVLVSVCGNGGRIAYLVVDFADGDGHQGC